MRKNQLMAELFLISLVGINLQACSSIQPAVQETPASTSTASPTLTSTLTPTPLPTVTPTPTMTPDLAATQQQENFVSFIQRVYEAGQIPTTKGSYQTLPNYFDSLAMSYGYRWTSTGIAARR